jgi:hypothetical protein
VKKMRIPKTVKQLRIFVQINYKLILLVYVFFHDFQWTLQVLFINVPLLLLLQLILSDVLLPPVLIIPVQISVTHYLNK